MIPIFLLVGQIDSANKFKRQPLFNVHKYGYTELPVISAGHVGNAHAFLQIFYYSTDKNRFIYLLDKEVSSKSGFYFNDIEMEALGKNFFPNNVKQAQEFLSSNNAFLILNSNDWFEARIKSNPGYSFKILEKGKLIAVDKRAEYIKYDETIIEFNKAIEINPNDYNAYNKRGETCYAKGSYDQAISDCTKAIELNPKLSWAYNSRGKAYHAKGNYDDAISDYTKFIALKPNFARAYHDRGDVYMKEGNYDQAISDYTKAIELNPNFAWSYKNRGEAYHVKGNYDQAISDYTKFIELKPNLSWAYHNRAKTYYSKHDYSKAWDDLHKVVELGAKVDSDFLDELKKASGREK